MAIIFHICKRISFAILTFVIIEELASGLKFNDITGVNLDLRRVVESQVRNRTQRCIFARDMSGKKIVVSGWTGHPNAMSVSAL